MSFLYKYVLISVVFLAAFTLQPKHITVYLIGDSTMSVKDRKAFPETGWGMPFANFFDSTVTVDNRARNGRSTKTFITDGLWQPVANNLEEGDYVLVQFGHNDEIKTKASYTTENEFSENLTRFIIETRAKKAIPVLITPVARRKFDTTGNIAGTHAIYAQLVRDIAVKNNVPLIDLDVKSQQMLQQLGKEQSRLLFNNLDPGEHPNYPDGRRDDTHFNELGARKMAEIVLKCIRDLNLELADRIVKPKK